MAVDLKIMIKKNYLGFVLLCTIHDGNHEVNRWCILVSYFGLCNLDFRLCKRWGSLPRVIAPTRTSIHRLIKWCGPRSQEHNSSWQNCRPIYLLTLGSIHSELVYASTNTLATPRSNVTRMPEKQRQIEYKGVKS